MRIIHARNVHCALPRGVYELRTSGTTSPSRNGDVLVAPGPVVTVYERPTERVLFWPERDANPFFHLMEGLWMLAGRNDVAFVSQFASNMKNYSDDGQVLHGAYGYRWRAWGGLDQIQKLIKLLTYHPNSRRAVLAMYDPNLDTREDEIGKDIPCNTHIYFSIDQDELDMTVCCRSNDMVWGAYGANAVHFSMLQEYFASMLGLVPGVYHQFSNNFHAYAMTLEPLRELYKDFGTKSPYEGDHPLVAPYPMVNASPKTWDRDLALFFDDPGSNGFDNQFFSRVAKPVYWAHRAYRQKGNAERFTEAKEIVNECLATDWKWACIQWLDRREGEYNERAS